MADASPSPESPRRRGRWGRRLIGLVVVLLVVLLALVLAAPPVASAIARSRIQQAVNQQIAGRIEVRGLSLSLFGGQSIGPIALYDERGAEVAELSAEVAKSGLVFVTSPLDIGEVVVRGNAAVVRREDGSLNVLTATAPRTPPPTGDAASGDRAGGAPSEPVMLPPVLAATLVLDGVTISLTDAALESATAGRLTTIALSDLRGRVPFSVGKPIDAQLKGMMRSGATTATLVDDGPVELTLALANLTAADGTVTPDLAEGTAQLSARTRGASLEARASVTGGVVSTEAPTELTIDLEQWSELVPALSEAVASAKGVEFEALPTLAVAVERFSLSLPASGAALDLRGASAVARVELGAVRGRADPSALGAAGATPAPFETQPLVLTLDASDVARVALRGGTAATFDGRPAGTLSIDATAEGLIDAHGALARAAPAVQGSVSLEGFSTAILQPFAALATGALPEGAALDLPNDLGPTLDMTLAATSTGAGSDATPATRVRLDARSQKLSASAPLVIQGSVLALDAGEPITVALSESASLLERLLGAALADQGASIERAERITLTIAELRADLDRLGAEGGADLRGLAARAAIQTTALAGTVRVGEELQRFTLGPVRAVADATALAEGRVSASLDAPAGLEGSAPGRIALTDASVSGLLDERGALAGGVPAARGTFELTGISASLLDRFAGAALAPTRIVLERDLGPMIDRLAITADTAKPGETALTLAATTPIVRLNAPIVVHDRGVRSNGTIELDHDRAAPLLDALAGDSASIRASGEGGKLRVRAFQIDIPFHAGSRTPRLDLAKGTATLQLGGTEIGAPGMPAGDMLVLRESRIEAKLEPGAVPFATLQASLAHRGQRFDAAGQLALEGLLGEPTGQTITVTSALRPKQVKPAASLTLTQAPPGAARAVLSALLPPAEDGSPSPLPAVAAEALGGPTDLGITLTPRAQEFVSDLAVRIASPGTRGTIEAAVAAFQIDLRAFELVTRVTPAAVEALRASTPPAPGAGPLPTLAAPAPVKLSIKPFVLPLDDYAPAFARSPDDLLADIELSDVTVTGVTMAVTGADGRVTRRDLGDFALRGGRARVKLPLRNIPLERPPMKVEADASGRVLAVRTGQAGTFTADAAITFDDGALVGTIPANVELRDLPVGFIDGLLGQPDALSGLLGETLGLDLRAVLEPAAEMPVRSAELSIASPRVNTPTPLKLAVSGSTLRLVQPGTITASLEPAWANRHLLGAGADPARPPKFLFADVVHAQFSLEELILPKDVASGPLKPGVFQIRAQAAIPEARLVLGQNTPASIGGGELRLTPPQQQGGTLGFTLQVARWTAADQRSAQGQPSTIVGTIFGLADANGAPTPHLANVSADLDFRSVPSRLIDAFAGSDLIEKTLGPSVSAKGSVRNLSATAGTYQLEARAENGQAVVRGELRPGEVVVYPGEVPLATLTRLTSDLTADLTKPIPLVESFEKQPTDQPALLLAKTNLIIPTDGNMDRLNGVLVFDPGTARFTARSDFLGFIKAPFIKSAGEVGRRLNPITLTADRGIVTYDRIILPVGEFEAEVIGVINLSSREYNNRELDLKAGPRNPAANVLGHLDILTFVPVGALANEVHNLGRLPVLGQVGQTGKFPLRTRGPLAGPKTEPDFDLFLRSMNPIANPDAINPGKLLEGVGDLIGGGRDRR